LRRLDVWPTGDLGVRKGWSIIAKSPILSEKEFEKVGDPFKPYRSLVAWYCWKATDESSDTW
jgi:DNA-3-methyladenine glycosylase II